MRKPLISDAIKPFVADAYIRGGLTQDAVATLYCVSRRTIQRALLDMGVPQKFNRQPPAPCAFVVLQPVQPAPPPNPVQLKLDLLIPPVNRDSVRKYLRELKPIPFIDLVLESTVSQGQQEQLHHAVQFA